MKPLNVTQALQQALLQGLERLDAQLLLGALVQQSRTWLQTHDDAQLTDQQVLRWGHWLKRRAAGEPLAYLMGEKEFYGLMLQVSPEVLVPRADTETLVNWALDVLRDEPTRQSTRVVDLGCGSGAVALAIKHSYPTAEMMAVDASPGALALAQENAKRLGLDVRFLSSNWWSALVGQRFHLALSNPPYIAENDPHLAALSHEPAMALTSGPSGLDDLGQLIEHAPEHLQVGAWLLLEHGHTQSPEVRGFMTKRGFSAVTTRTDLAGHERCTGGRWIGNDH